MGQLTGAGHQRHLPSARPTTRGTGRNDAIAIATRQGHNTRRKPRKARRRWETPSFAYASPHLHALMHQARLVGHRHFHQLAIKRKMKIKQSIQTGRAISSRSVAPELTLIGVWNEASRGRLGGSDGEGGGRDWRRRRWRRWSLLIGSCKPAVPMESNPIWSSS